MLKIIVFLLIFAVSSIVAQNQTGNSAFAGAFINALAKKDFATAYDYFGDEIKSQIKIESMPQLWMQITNQFGEFQKVNEIITSPDSSKIVLVNEFEKAAVGIDIYFNDKGKIASFTLNQSKTILKNQPKYETPKYADPNLFEEREVTVGTGEWALPATLTMPKGKTNVPAIVLVHGSGPNDRDETHTNPANKVFRDLAWGLASKGIAVLRYEKRTRQYGAKFAALKNYTINDETVDDAISAVQLLRQTPNINIKNIFVLGHSLGGMAIPRIGQRDAKIVGLISFAGTSRPLEDVIVEQYNYLFSLDGKPSAELQSELDALKQLAEKTKNLKPTDPQNTPTILSLAVSYWVDLNSYDPPKVAATLKQSMLILQGESDYQVTMQDFAKWKESLDKKKTVTFKSYPNLTHTFMEGLGGKPSPKDYEKTNNVNEAVVSDIAAWILKTSKK